MDQTSFYQGLLYELQKKAQSTQVAAAGAAKPAPTNDLAPSGAAAATPAPTNAGGLEPANAPKPNNPKPQWHNLSRVGNAAHGVSHTLRSTVGDNIDRVVPYGIGSIIPKGIAGTIDTIGQGLTDRSVKAQGLEKIRGAGAADIFSPGLNPQQEMAAEYGMSRPGIAKEWNSAVADKSYGAASLNERGKLQMGGAPGGFQGKKFLNDHWGKILMSLLGVGALGWLGNRGGQQQQPIVINNNQGGMQGGPRGALPGYGG